MAQERGLGNLFILDDGFQHRRLFRNVDLVTIDPLEWVSGERLFPYGRWREPKEALQRAHAAIVQKAIQDGETILPDLPVPSFFIETVVEGIYKGSELVPPSFLKNHAITAFAGIAKPDRFFNSLESLGITTTKKVRFRDHHAYSESDIQMLPGEIYITTEKDAVRLESLAAGAFLHLRISANIPQFDRLMELIRSRLT
jgi:tetraacyldisaccharide 4'-kinase